MLSVRATAERAVDVAREDALNTARCEIERKFNERAAFVLQVKRSIVREACRIAACAAAQLAAAPRAA